MAVYNYAERFTDLLQQKYETESKSDDLTKSNLGVQFINAQTIKLPRMTVSGYKDHTRTAGFNAGTLSNDWEPKKLEHDRDIEFFIDPMDIDETNLTLSVANIQNTFETEQAIPEKDCYRFSKLYSELNTYKSITKKENTNSINYQPINKEWWMEDYDECLSHLYGSIDLEYFPESLREVVAEIIGYMADAFCSNLPTQRINGEDIPRKRVITKLMKVSEETIDTVIYDFRNLKEKIKNHRNYIISALYNAASSEHIETESEFSRTHSEEVGK